MTIHKTHIYGSFQLKPHIKFSCEFPNAYCPDIHQYQKLNGQQTHTYGARFENSQQASLGQPKANKTHPGSTYCF